MTRAETLPELTQGILNVLADIRCPVCRQDVPTFALASIYLQANEDAVTNQQRNLYTCPRCSVTLPSFFHDDRDPSQWRKLRELVSSPSYRDGVSQEALAEIHVEFSGSLDTPSEANLARLTLAIRSFRTMGEFEQAVELRLERCRLGGERLFESAPEIRNWLIEHFENGAPTERNLFCLAEVRRRMSRFGEAGNVARQGLNRMECENKMGDPDQIGDALAVLQAKLFRFADDLEEVKRQEADHLDRHRRRDETLMKKRQNLMKALGHLDSELNGRRETWLESLYWNAFRKDLERLALAAMSRDATLDGEGAPDWHSLPLDSPRPTWWDEKALWRLSASSTCPP